MINRKMRISKLIDPTYFAKYRAIYGESRWQFYDQYSFKETNICSHKWYTANQTRCQISTPNFCKLFCKTNPHLWLTFRRNNLINNVTTQDLRWIQKNVPEGPSIINKLLTHILTT